MNIEEMTIDELKKFIIDLKHELKISRLQTRAVSEYLQEALDGRLKMTTLNLESQKTNVTEGSS